MNYIICDHYFFAFTFLSFLDQNLVFFFNNKTYVILVLMQVLRPIVPKRTQAYKWVALHGCLSKGSQPLFTRDLEKTTENSKPLGRQAGLGFDPGTSRLPVLSVTVEPVVGLCKFCITDFCFLIYLQSYRKRLSESKMC